MVFMILKNNVKCSTKALVLAFLVAFVYFTFSSSQFAQGHFDHLAHNNAAGFGISENYYVNEQTDPEFPKPNELSKIQFSVQDRNGHDVKNIIVMVVACLGV